MLAISEKVEASRSKFSAAGSTEVQETADHSGATVRVLGQESFNEIYVLISTLEDRLRATTEQSRSEKGSSRIFLDDAHNALQSLDMPMQEIVPKAQDFKTFMRPEDLEKAVQKAAMRAVKGFEKSAISKPPPSLTERNRRVKERKKRTKCHDCSERGHWKGDKECPEQKKKADTVSNESTPSGAAGPPLSGFRS